MPQSLGYAAIAGVPVLVGLYSIPLALIAYALFGSSPRLVVGPVSTVSVLSGSLVADLSGGDPDRAVAMTSALALSAGVGLIIGGLLKLGWAAEFMSRPIVTGFVFGLVLLIILGRSPACWACHRAGRRHRKGLVHFTSLGRSPADRARRSQGTHRALRRREAGTPGPGGLVVLIGHRWVGAWNLSERGVATVGVAPTGFPPFGLPGVGLADLGRS